MKLLLDTHVLLWWLGGDASLSAAAFAAIDDDANAIHVSAASAWEISTKQRLGRLDAIVLGGCLDEVIAQQAFLSLGITINHAERAGAMHPRLKDPFDHLLAAQAQAENMTIVSNHSVFDRYSIPRLW